MLLSEVFSTLTYGELKQLSEGGKKEGGIFPKYSDEILSHLNIALTDLYRRFPIHEKELIIRTQAGKTTYKLETAGTVSSGNPDAYIIDTVEEPFLNDVLRINAAFNAAGKELVLNDELEYDSIMLPSYNTLQITHSNGLEEFYFIYRVDPVDVVIPDGSTPSNVKVPLPDFLMQALCTYIASRVHKARGGDKGRQEAILAMQEYEKYCQEIEEKNLFNNSHTNQNQKLELMGWP